MKKPNGLKPLTPMSVSDSFPTAPVDPVQIERERWTRMLTKERKRHTCVENYLVRQLEQMQRANAELLELVRGSAVQRPALRVSPSR